MLNRGGFGSRYPQVTIASLRFIFLRTSRVTARLVAHHCGIKRLSANDSKRARAISRAAIKIRISLLAAWLAVARKWRQHLSAAPAIEKAPVGGRGRS